MTDDSGKSNAAAAQAGVAALRDGAEDALAADNAALRAQLRTAAARIAELESQTREDPLTGLQNRRGLGIELERAVDLVKRYRAPISVLFVDLDGFKAVNDEFGHAFGDRVLCRVAELLDSHVRRSDVVGRIGGDEFVVLLWQTDAATAAAKATALAELIAGSSMEVDGRRIALRASIGATEIGPDDADGVLVLARADKAMYAVKNARRGDGAAPAGPGAAPA